ncbi:hypothetical protein AQUCO_01000291v1 [Aquilegia coerulea]|uniref:Serpin domain-containing protein n=1 Tax=Aquilegia coerulea TaxID=218851 RepID=A0A2G5E9B5_AQUCA|nr:hypothetical protein AQUCO_01000291v1 [Aquilegia coerulea]
MVKDLSKEAKENNFVYSPSSIQLAMSLVANGSDGSTLSELLTFLEAKDLNHLNSVAEELVNTFTGSNEGQQILSFVGGVWIDESLHLNPTFKTIVESIYKGQAKAVNFQNKAAEVIDEVNLWAEDTTNGLIKSVLPQGSLNEITRLVLANALYFKGNWTEEFPIRKTVHRTFYLLNGKSVQVPFMSNSKNQYIETFEDFKVLRLPYKRNCDEKAAVSMYIILPDKHDGLRSLLEKVGDDPLFLEKHLSPGTEAVKMRSFWVPKFKITHEFEASNILQDMGLKLPFSGSAEFDKMLQNSHHTIHLKVSTVHHTSRIEVNERGTEATASTGASLIRCIGMLQRPPQVDFVADHPFMFILRDDISGIILFMGNVVNPLLE